MSIYCLEDEVFDETDFEVGPINPLTVECGLSPQEKEKYVFLSEDTQPVVPHMMSVNPLPGIERVYPHVQGYLEYYCSRDDLRYANLLDIDADTPEDKQGPVQTMLEHFGRVLRHDFTPVYTRDKQSLISKAYAASFVAFLNKEVPLMPSSIRVLILGAGRGQDIRRILETVTGKAMFVCVEPSKRARKAITKAFPQATLIPRTPGDATGEIAHFGPYDLIVSNMTFHNVVGVESAPRVIKTLESVLKPRGIWFGSYIDSNVVRTSGAAQYARLGHSVAFLGYDRDHLIYGERSYNGVASISVAGTVWQDPVIDQFHVHQLFSESTLCVNILDGHTILFGPDKKSPMYKAPELFTTALIRPELQFYRAVLITKSFHPDPVSSIGIPRSLVDDREWGNIELASVLDYNKGRPLQPWELQFIDPSLVLVADKKDGIPAKLVMYNGSFHVVLDGANNRPPKTYRYKNLSTSFKGSCVLQIELMSTGVCQREYVEDLPYEFVVIDVLKHPEGILGSFMSRWKWLQQMVKTNHALTAVTEGGRTVTYPTEWPFVLQGYHRLDSVDAFIMMREVTEGIVVQPVSAVMGAVSAKAGSARYIKKRPTVDVRRGGKIVEIDFFTGEYIRDRPDKKEPNPPLVVQRIRTAVTYSEFLAYAFAKVIDVPDADIKRVVEYIRRSVPLAKWNKSDLLWAFFHRGDADFKKLLPNVSAFLESAVINYCCKTAKQISELVDELEEDVPEIVLRTPDGYEVIQEARRGNYAEIGRAVPPILDLQVGDFASVCPEIWANDLTTFVEDLRTQKGYL